MPNLAAEVAGSAATDAPCDAAVAPATAMDRLVARLNPRGAKPWGSIQMTHQPIGLGPFSGCWAFPW